MILSEKQKELIEKLGVLNKQNGLPPAECRVWALFLVADEVELTFDEIRETLMLSKSATSNALNTLQLTNNIEYITKLGDRKRYFRCKMNTWVEMTKQNFSKFYDLNIILKEILEIRNPKTESFNQDLKQATDFIDYVHIEFTKSIAKWKPK